MRQHEAGCCRWWVGAGPSATSAEASPCPHLPHRLPSLLLSKSQKLRASFFGEVEQCFSQLLFSGPFCCPAWKPWQNEGRGESGQWASCWVISNDCGSKAGSGETTVLSQQQVSPPQSCKSSLSSSGHVCLYVCVYSDLLRRSWQWQWRTNNKQQGIECVCVCAHACRALAHWVGMLVQAFAHTLEGVSRIWGCGIAHPLPFQGVDQVGRPIPKYKAALNTADFYHKENCIYNIVYSNDKA